MDNSKSGNPERVARRVSMAQRIASLEAEKQAALAEAKGTSFTPLTEAELNLLETTADDSVATSTMLHASLFGEDFYAEPVLTVTQAGALQATDIVAAAELFHVRWEDAQPFNAAFASSHHLLLLDTEVDPRELEALAVSIWANARWAGNGELHLFDGASLKGPFKISASDANSLGVPLRFEQIWVLDIAPERVPAGPVFPGVVDPWAGSFLHQHPAGAELGALNALLRMSKRLAGAVRIASDAYPGHAQQPVQPDPESSVNLRVYAARWLDEADLLRLLRGYYPDLALASTHSGGQAGLSRSQAREHLALAIDIPEDEVERIADITESADAKAHAGTVDYQPYSMLASAGNRSRVHITVNVVEEHLPMAVRHQPWPFGRAVEYGISWLAEDLGMYSSFNVPPAGSGLGNGLGLSRTLRLERGRVRSEIEKIALLLAKTCSGVILDEDGFLIAD